MKHLLQHFKTLTKHPKNAEELKGLILQLAVQGKLTENWRQENPNVEPASKLLERIKEEKARLVAEKKIKKEKPLPPITEEEIPYDLPEGWVWCRLGEAVTYGTKFKAEKTKVTNDTWVLELEDVEKSTSRLLKKVRFNERQFKSTKSIFKKGDVIYGKLRPYLDKVLVADEDGVCTTEMIPISSHAGCSSEYLKWYLKNPDFISYANDSTHGMNLPRMGTDKATNAVYALPPLEEQKAIVAMVNELFKEVEQLEALTKTRVQLKEDFVTSALQRLSQTDNLEQEWQWLQSHFTEFFTEKQNVKQLRDTLLQLAVQGKLTQTWRARHPELVSGSHHASELLKRIQTEKQQLIAQKKIKKEKPLPPIEDHEKPYELPETWGWSKLGDLGYAQTGTTPPTKNHENYGNFIPFLGPSNISNSYMEYPNEGLSEIGLDKGRLIEANSLMMVCIGGSMGKCNVNTIDVSCNQQINTLKTLASPIDYVKIMCQSPYFQNEVWTRSTGSATPMINKNKWLQIPISLPPLEEQKAIVEKVNALMALCDSLEEHIENSNTQIEQLMQSCLSEVLEPAN